MKVHTFSVLLSLVSCSIAIPYADYILAPKSRVLFPVAVRSSNGSVSGPENLTSSSGSTIFKGDAATTYDFGKNIAGVVTLNVTSVSDTNQYIGVTFSESSLWISNESSDGTSDSGHDEILWFQPRTPGSYPAPREKERGGFRYLTLVHNGTGSIEISSVEVYFTPMPHWGDNDLTNYTGYFHSDDELLNRIWYAGAYTNQMCTIDPKYGNALVYPGPETNSSGLPWYNNGTIANGTSALTDGAKRDRIVWAGDMVIAVPGIVTSTNDVISIENSINALFALQNATDGRLPFGGTVLFASIPSFTYHLYTLLGVTDHYLYTGNLDFAASLWPRWKFAMNFSLGYIDETDLMNVTAPADWLRFGMGGHNIEANAILYYTLNEGVKLAEALNDTESVASWQATAEKIKVAANERLWDSNAGMYIDNETTTLMPQDGNSWAVISNLTLNSSQAESISNNLVQRWTAYGAPAPEAADAISPFISGFELRTHFAVGNTTAALDLMRLQWGFMLNDPRMTNSTFIEGYSTTGALHYAPYKHDTRISHAHGWATGPTSSLTFLVAGIQLLSAGGKSWRIAPSLGNLTIAEAGFSTEVGFFSAKTQLVDGGFHVDIETPEGTSGEIRIPQVSCTGRVFMEQKTGDHRTLEIDVVNKDAGPISIAEVPGGKWEIRGVCNGSSVL